ncbi:(d)CMP kinase [Tengunoibacter tsumagoiensis]|uniref:Cytidylate kinase n=1 Tax=Tengunoibacter tsumagoiensis TaxID=2014871 RepID=A0A402A5K3_9CHLR|nr:(d)CMP kinase [Tengunoibacter tsumagoiensis]GCE14359.1 cytidylate kinase [Tengunoibacter tsumagoiensis]
MQGPHCIAIDGPAGSGKSTVGERLAQLWGYLYVDTGAMYRAVAWLALHEDIDISDGRALGELAQRANVKISKPEIADGRQYTVTVHGRDITWEIRSPAVTQAVSPVSSHPEVRSLLIAQQRKMAEQGSVVMVGRDIGAVVLPDAEMKIYLTASLEERARRRHAELLERLGEHNPALPTLEAVIKDIQRRDDIDRDNMLMAKDAIVVETDHRSISQVVEVITHLVENRR